MAKELENLEVTGNELNPRDRVQDVHFGMETTRVFFLMTGDERVAGTLLISLLGDVWAGLIPDPSRVFEEFTYHTYSQASTEDILFKPIDPKTNMDHKYKASKKLTANHQGYIDVVTKDGYYIQPSTTRYDSEQRRQIENLRLRSVQISVNC